MNEKISALLRLFDEKIALCQARNRELNADERRDEATFEKVRANVYDIFRTVLLVAQKSAGGDVEKLHDFFAQKLAQIPANWKTAYEAAVAHDDALARNLEGIKLETADEIATIFSSVWEGTK